MVKHGCTKSEVKAYIIQMLACYDTPSQVVEAVQKDFGIAITRQQVETHDPTKVSGKTLAKKWVGHFNLTRDRFLNEISDIPIANKAYRLRVLQRMSTTAENMKNIAMTAQLLEQAAKEVVRLTAISKKSNTPAQTVACRRDQRRSDL
ncbi:Uncharacterized conserved protein [Klebsiella variicola]|nr:Uncharacterized conserved protein [Klebsiella variicola]